MARSASSSSSSSSVVGVVLKLSVVVAIVFGNPILNEDRGITNNGLVFEAEGDGGVAGKIIFSHTR
jgi:hypothetical protein